MRNRLNLEVLTLPLIPSIPSYGHEIKLRAASLKAVLLVSIALTAIFLLNPALSSLPNTVSSSYPSSGTISVVSPLHVVGSSIENSLNQIVVLRGVNLGGFNAEPGGKWNGTSLSTYSQWQSHQSLVTNELDEVKALGCNCIRSHLAVDFWVLNTSGFQVIMDQYLTLCQSKGIYVILDGFQVTNYFAGGSQDPLPYPPYATSPGASAIIPSEAAYENIMLDMAETLGPSHSNLILSMWNEAQGSSTNDWSTVEQTTVSMIRGAGVTNILLMTEGYGIWANLQYPPNSPPSEGGNPAQTLGWINDYNINGSNLAYDFHYYDAFGQDCTYAQDITGLQDCWVQYELQNISKPLICGEVGADVWWANSNYPPIDWINEAATFDETLSIFNSWGISWTAFDFGTSETYALLNTYGPSWTPSIAGTIVIANLGS